MSVRTEKILCIMPNRSWPVGDIRLRFPLERLAESEPGAWDIVFRAVFDLSPEDMRGVGAVIIQRQASPFIVRLARRLAEARIPYIYEIDDLLWDMPAFLESASVWTRRRAELLELIRNADFVSTTTERLAEKLRPFNPNVAQIPNVLPQTTAEESDNLEQSPVLLIGATDRMAVAHVIPALVRLQEHSDIPVVAVGPVAEALAAAKVRVQSYPLMEYREFAGFLRRFADAVAVALLPLDGSEFSGCKSPVKYLSYAEARIPVIADAVPPYSDIIVHDRNGWLADGTPEGWERAIRTLLDERSRRERYVNAYDELALPTLNDTARLWSGLLKAVAVRPPDTAECPIAKLPAAWNWSQLRYFTHPRKYCSCLKLVSQHGIKAVFPLLRKGM